uniref:Endosome-associated-trafficking regulator 1 n=1 Tax=Macrostomum lignano TaxID=282301 RepID=A0A1I8J742_9PLAT
MSKFAVLKVEGLSSSEDSDTNNESKKTTGNGRVPGSTLTRIEAESRRAANATVRREKLTEKELIRQEVELELQAKFQEALAVKEAENESLRAETDSLKRSLASSEAQVAHLNSLLSLVEGKKAKGLSEQIYQLTSVISELTDSTKVLDSELEKEKTKSRQLQDQLDKLRSSAAR